MIKKKQGLIIRINLIFIILFLIYLVFIIDVSALFTDGLVTYYRFDNQSAYGENSTLVYDFSGNGNNGTVYGGAITNGTIVYGSSIYIDGVNDLINKSTPFNFMKRDDNFTVCFYATTFVTGAVNRAFLSNIYNSTERFQLQYYNTQFYAGVSDGGVNRYGAYSVSLNQNNVLYHICYVKGDNATFYVNGINNTGGYVSTFYGSPGNEFVIGAKNDRNPTQYYNGLIDELIIWNRTLTNAEVSNIYGHCYGLTGEDWFIDGNCTWTENMYNPTKTLRISNRSVLNLNSNLTIKKIVIENGGKLIRNGGRLILQ